MLKITEKIWRLEFFTEPWKLGSQNRTNLMLLERAVSFLLVGLSKVFENIGESRTKVTLSRV